MNQHKPNAQSPPSTLASIEKRLRRLESRVVQLMIHMGLNPYAKVYDGDEPEIKREKEKEAEDGRH